MESIRKAIIEDVPSINKLLYQVHDVHYHIRPDLFLKDKKKYSDQEIIEIIKDNKSPIFVYEEENEVIAYIFCKIIDEASDSHTRIRSMYIDDLCVDVEKRGAHIATKLYEYAKIYAKSINCHNIYLNVWEGNESAKAFYKSLGMKVQKTTFEEIL